MGRASMSTTFFQAVAACPACGAPTSSARTLFDVPFLDALALVLECQKCGLCYKSLIPTEEGLRRIYARDYEHFQDEGPVDLGEVYSAKQKLATVRRLLGPSRAPRAIRVLDIGCGRGRFVEVARRLGYQADGIDPYLPPEAEGEHVRRGEPGDVAPASYDVASLLNVVEHVIDPHPLFVAARRLLRPGGVLLITCPYGGSLARRFHQAQWVHLALDEHLLFWTPRALSLALRADGFLGASRCRIAGSPFPYGRVPRRVTAAEHTPSPAAPPSTGKPPARPAVSLRLQARVWRVARALMRREAVSNLIRKAVHQSHSGDYLELAIATE